MKQKSVLNNIIIALAFLFIAFGLILPLFVKYLLNSSSSFAVLGTIGDWYGGLSGPLIGLSSFLLVFVAFRLQNKQLESQQKEFANQNKAISYQRFESSFFQLLSFHNEIVQSLWTRYEYITSSKIEERPLEGGKPGETKRVLVSNKKVETSDKREYFATAYLMLSHNLDEIKKKSESLSKEMKESISYKESVIIENYNFVYNKEQASLGHYFRNLYHVVKYVHLTDLIDDKQKYYYLSILRAQLSAYELVFLLYNCLVDGLGYPKFKYLVDKYDLLQNINDELLLDHDDWKVFKSKSIIECPF